MKKLLLTTLCLLQIFTLFAATAKYQSQDYDLSIQYNEISKDEVRKSVNELLGQNTDSISNLKISQETLDKFTDNYSDVTNDATEQIR